MRSKPVLFGVVVLLAAVVAAVLLWRDPWSWQRGRVRIVGAGEDTQVVRADALSESVLPEALDAARMEAGRLQVAAFIVHRSGHRIFEYYAPGNGGTDLVDGGELAAAALKLALHRPEDATADVPAVAQLLGERIWLPLRAADAWFSDADPDGKLRACCVEARLDDWMRVADMMNGMGTYLGERVIAADEVRRLLTDRVLQWQGDEPLLARDAAAFDLQDGVRVWLAPRRGLTMLVRSSGDIALDTLLPNIILRGLNDVSPAIGGDISDLVPGH